MTSRSHHPGSAEEMAGGATMTLTLYLKRISTKNFDGALGGVAQQGRRRALGLESMSE